MVFNATFNNLSVILWQSVLLVEETMQSTRRKSPTCQTLSHYTINYSLRSQYQDMRTSRLGTQSNLTWPRPTAKVRSGHREWQDERYSYPGNDFLCSNQLFYYTEINWIRLLPFLLSLSYNFYSSNRVRK